MTKRNKTEEEEEEEEERPFLIRTYGKGELASLYMPDVQQQTAVNRFNEWLQQCPGLLQRLRQTGWRTEARKYTPAQVRIITKAFGPP